MISEDGTIAKIIDRSKVKIAKAPQSFYLKDILEAHCRAQDERIDFIDSASMMQHYGYNLYTVDGPTENLKITHPSDLRIFRAFVDDSEKYQTPGAEEYYK